ncbi:amidohydrolase [Pseudorhodobacter aquimaris]|uniref:amidohydrolase n=1 Tax=Pseudorhodobacter aquimaris TaxID=687412 RepID=UPI000ADFBDD8|nr:amidohydrolase [Pseudorhodobacter aquimaris]
MGDKDAAVWGGVVMLTNSDIAELTALRHELHRFPEVSGIEAQTAVRVVAALGGMADQLVTGLGGHGVAAVFDSGAPGPTVLFRCELDALPIQELSEIAHRSTIPGVAHLCGHDGHMAILLGLARLLSRKRPARGRVVLMFQPAEEDGSGAAAVVADAGFAGLRPDWAFSLHNMPGVRLGECWLAEGPMACASVGVRIALEGKTSHAAQPEHGISPALALAELIPALGALGTGGALSPDFRLLTLTHAQMGEPAFGISPAHGELWATLRTMTDPPMAALKAQVFELAQEAAEKHGLALSTSLHDDFKACANDAQATAHIAAALDGLDIAHAPGGLPMRPSEDFGAFAGLPDCKIAMVMLGAGLDHPSLHNPDYDFPDDLIAIGTRIFCRIARDMLG